jgi:hypothetical protein
MDAFLKEQYLAARSAEEKMIILLDANIRGLSHDWRSHLDSSSPQELKHLTKQFSERLAVLKEAQEKRIAKLEQYSEQYNAENEQ